MDKERERIINEIREKLDGLFGHFEPKEPTFILETSGDAYRVESVYLDEDHCVHFYLISEKSGGFSCDTNFIATESLLKISEILPAKFAVVRFHTPYCESDWFVSREAIPADGDESGSLFGYLLKYYSALRWSYTEKDNEFVAYPEEEEYSGAYFIATVED